MLCIRSKTFSSAFNIATEEFLLQNKNEDCFFLYINEPSIIVGKNQNSLAEINVDYVKENNITVVRRLSGGGAVFHDPGNLNFSFIMNDNVEGFEKYTQPILDVLKSLGVDAKLEGRNDLLIKDKKFSGNAKHYFNGKVLQHGTLLFSSKLPDLSDALKANPLKFQDKAIKSIRSRVTNISEHLSQPISLQDFEEKIITHVMSLYNDSKFYELTENDIYEINKLVNEKYGTWDWNYGKSPKYNFQKGIKTKGGHIEINLEVQKGIIQNAKIFGDFFNVQNISELEQSLIGVEHNTNKIQEVLTNLKLKNFIENVTVEEFTNGCF